MTQQTDQSLDDMLSDIWSDLDGTRPPESRIATVDDSTDEQQTPNAATNSTDEAPSPFAAAPANFAVTTSTHNSAPSLAKSSSSGSDVSLEEDNFTPKAPRSLKEAGLSDDELSRLIMKLLSAQGGTTGRNVSGHVKLPFVLVERILKDMRREQMVVLKGEAIAGDYTYVITEKGLALAKELTRECTYYGAAPISLAQYVAATKAQTITGLTIRAPALKKAFSDLLLEPSMLLTLGPAVNSGRGLFLFGEPGNGKTSIAERVAKSFGSMMWIPRALGIDGQIIRVFDPAIHEEVPLLRSENNMTNTEIDQRWVHIKRPTVVAGGELTMSELEVTQDASSKICEAPLQLKSNGGVLLIDDFGRQRMPVDELLNRWIVPLEKRYDLLNLPSGKKCRCRLTNL